MEDRVRKLERQLTRQHQEVLEVARRELSKLHEAIEELLAENDAFRDKMLNPRTTYGGTDYGVTT